MLPVLRTEQGVDDGVCEDVGVGCPSSPRGIRVGRRRVSWAAFDEAVQVITESDAHHQALSHDASANRVDGVVTLKFTCDPSTSFTGYPSGARGRVIGCGVGRAGLRRGLCG